MLEGRVAVVTGAASGIGRATALAYAREGAKVVVSDINEKGLAETADAVRGEGPDVLAVKTDVSDASECADLVESTIKAFGRIDAACNNAGIADPTVPLAEIGLDQWAKTIAVNLSGVFYCLKYEIKAMLQNKTGSIVNISSGAGRIMLPGGGHYVAAKHGVVGLTKAAAVEYARDGIRVNVIGPGAIETPILSALPEELLQGVVTVTPIGRMGRPGEVAEAVVWLSSDRASFVTGTYLAVDGGLSWRNEVS